MSSRLAHAAGRPIGEPDLQRLAVIAFIHDVGKLNTGFQSKAWPESPTNVVAAGHVQEGMDLLHRNFRRPEIFENLSLETIYEWAPEDQINDYLRASISHHGVPAKEGRSDGRRTLGPWQPVRGYDPATAARQMGEPLSAWFPRAFGGSSQPLPDRPRFIHLFAGLVSLADWIGSARDVFQFVPNFDPNYFVKARARAAKALKAFGILNPEQRLLHQEPISFSRLTGFSEPNLAQAAIGTVDASEQLVILEAETGSGKTEAALLRFVRLWEAGKVDSLFFAVPTRAAAAQLHGRVHEAIKRIFESDPPETLLAVPGYFKVGNVKGRKAERTEGRPLPEYKVLWDDEKWNTPERIARRWAAENSKRYLAAQVAVGTVDQAMLASLPVKHAHLRGASLARSLLVIDEVHASDRYMTEVQLGLLDIHLGIGGHTLLMSATLGERARAKWLKQNPLSLTEAEAAPYPAIWTGNGNAVAPEARKQSSRQKHVSMSLLATETPADCLDDAVESAKMGAKVLIVRNTVGLAIETIKALEERVDDPSVLLSLKGRPAPHHGRFSPGDRQLLDREVENAIGKNRAAGGKIIVGTQTLEQSLDIDADLLVTDLCPADVLLQRIGRLYRHPGRKDRALEGPRCVVLTPAKGLDACLADKKPQMINGLGAFERDGVLGGIYTDLITVEATRRLVSEHPTWEIPAMNRLLVERATHKDAHAALLDTLPEEWRHYEFDVLAKEIAEAQQAHLVRLDTETPYGECRFPDEERVRTRLGGEGITITFPEPPDGPFGEKLDQLTLPEHWSVGLDPMDTPTDINREDDTVAFTFSGRRFRYSRYGLEKEKNA